MQVDISTVDGRLTIAERISNAIDAKIESEHTEEFRTHLGASVIGGICDRAKWYHFHWFVPERPRAIKLRLFDDGHRAEPRIRNWLRSIGCVFLDTVDTDGKQIKVAAIGDHFGGSVDGIFIAPHLGLETPCLLEIKTSGTGAGFKGLVENGVEQTKKQHFVQQSIYGRLLNIQYACYIAYNKNDSSLHVEIIELSEEVADEHIALAHRIITIKNPPRRIGPPSWYQCAGCTYKGVCHENKPAHHNCRSCQHSTPIDNAQWHCAKWNAIIPTDVSPVGCVEYKELPNA